MNDGTYALGDLAAAVVATAGARQHVERHKVADRASWLAMRERDVTASAVGALLGVHEFTSAYALWALKTGRVAEDPDETAPMQRGRLLEPVAVQLMREQRPSWTIEQPGLYLRDPTIRLGATPDVFAVDPARGPGIIQVKSVEGSVFARKWRDTDTGEVTPPLWIAVQAITEAHLAGAAWAAVGAMTVGFGLDLHLVEVPIHAGVVERIRAAVAEFWAMVADGREPDPDYARDGRLLAQLFAQDDGSEIDLTGDNMLPELSGEDARLAAEIKEREARRREIKAELLAKMGGAAVARIDGQVFATAKTVNRKGFAVQPTTYRDIRFKRSAA